MRWYNGPLLACLFFALFALQIENTTTAQEISFWETFALSEDREKTLQQLVPGSEDWFFFHCLHFQNNSKLDEVDAMLKRWAKTSGKARQYEVIESRQALLRYGEDPRATLEFLKKKLDLDFNHQRKLPEAQRDLASKLDPSRIDTEKIINRLLRSDSNSLSGFEKAGFKWLAGKPLNTRQRRDLLKKIDDPTFPGLVDLIAADLQGKGRSKFGSLKIHRQLTKAQLDQLAKKVAPLASQQNYIDEYLLRLLPSTDVSIEHSPEERQALVQRQWKFVQKLAPAHNSLKASVLYHLLDIDRRSGKYDRNLFARYLEIPRNVPYINRDLKRNVSQRSHIANLDRSYVNLTRCLPINVDAPLVREYLHHFLAKATGPKEFLPFFEEQWLQKQFATARILAGQGDREQLASLLEPSEYQSLLERIDLDFALTNGEHFGHDETIELSLFTKNIDKLIVKVFEINTHNVYRRTNAEIDTDIKLDGLVANSEKLYQYDDSPLVRVRRDFKFEDLKDDGVYIIDFIGGGQSSRALVRRGRMFMVGKVTPIGQRFNVINDQGSVVMDATVEVGGRKYQADKDGYIDMPFTAGATRQFAIISVGEFSCLQAFDAVRENYTLKAAFHVDRESLASGNEATVIVRPSFRITGGHPLPLTRLKSSQLEIVTTTIDGTTSTKTISDFAIDESRDASAAFRVPARLREINFVLRTKVESLLKKQIDLSASDSFTINQIDSTDKVQDVHFLPTSAGFFLEIRGKTGEARPRQPVRVSLKLAGLKRSIKADLQSDADGRIELGKLVNVESVSASLAGASAKTWQTNLDRLGLASNYHLLAGETLELPWELGDKTVPSLVSLIEVNDQRSVADRFENLLVKNGRLLVEDLQPGDYRLRFPDVNPATDHEIRIRVTKGRQAAGGLVGQSRVLSSTAASHPHVAGASVKKDTLTIGIAGAGQHTRVHVFPMRYSPAFNPADQLDAFNGPGAWTWDQTVQSSRYIAGRKIGEEYQYILDRRYQKQFPGNMLDRPTLLLNPWALQETANESQIAAQGQMPGAAGSAAEAQRRSASERRQQAAQQTGFANLDFLGGGQDALINLTPDDKGQIQISAKELAGSQHIRIVVVDLFSVSQKSIFRELKDVTAVDQRLAESLDSEKHFIQQRQIDVLDAGESLVIEDFVNANFQYYDELSDVFQLYQNFGNDAGNLRKFAFVMQWLEKSPAEKRSLYSEFACHELNFFIYKKDRPFFDEVVVTHLKHKRERTFIDQWLLEEDLGDWFEPWKFSRLNAFEKILLSQRLTENRADIVRHVQELYELNPTTRQQFGFVYDMAQQFDDDGDLRELEKSKDRTRKENMKKSLPKLGKSRRAGDRFDLSFEADEFGAESLQLGQNVYAAPAEPMQSGQRQGGQAMGGEMINGIIGGAGGYEFETKTRSVPVTKMRTETRSRRVPVKRIIDGKEVIEMESQNYTVQVPYTENVTQQYQVLTPPPVNYRRVEPTREWVENNYWHLNPSSNTAARISVNQFWKDFAAHESGPFASDAFALANSNLTEMIMALAVLDLPMTEVKEKIDVADNKVTINADGPMIVLHQQNEQVAFEGGDTNIFVSENFFQAADRYRYEEGVRFDKFVSGDFLAGVLYGAEVVITNPTSTPLAIDVLLQIPQGAMPISGSRTSQSIAMQLNAFSTQKLEYWFYFPTAGEFAHYRSHVSTGAKVLAVAESRDFNVTDKPAKVDETSWVWISQNGTEQQVIEYLETENIQRLDPTQIAFRMKDKAFFGQAIELLRDRCRYDHTLWSYAVKHNDKEAIREFLGHENRILSTLGMAFESDILDLQPLERNWYQQRDYTPLINSRIHQLGSKRRILNPRFLQQYERLMRILGNRQQLTADQHLVVTYYMLLQDRIEEALSHFEKVDADSVDAKMQYAYCDAYLDLYREKPDDALAKASKWLDYPVDRWRTKFENVVAMVKEIQGAGSKVIDEKSREQQQDQLAANTQSFDLNIEPGEDRGTGRAVIEYRNLESVVVNYYQMDIEFLFSSNPFASDQADGFSMIKPNKSETIKLSGDSGTHKFDLPEQFNNKNVLVEVVGGEQTRSRSWFANSMNVQMIEAYGQVALAHAQSDKPISGAYVKVFAKYFNGQTRFHKDGYTDLRGRFDYVSQSNTSLEGIVGYSVLLMSDQHGAVIREARTPRE